LRWRQVRLSNFILELYASNPKDVPTLEANAALRQQIAELVATRLDPWCRKYGFAWRGFRFSSPDWAPPPKYAPWPNVVIIRSEIGMRKARQVIDFVTL
jgi:hypothetical protein